MYKCFLSIARHMIYSTGWFCEETEKWWHLFIFDWNFLMRNKKNRWERISSEKTARLVLPRDKFNMAEHKSWVKNLFVVFLLILFASCWSLINLSSVKDILVCNKNESLYALYAQTQVRRLHLYPCVTKAADICAPVMRYQLATIGYPGGCIIAQLRHACI